ncbi:uncharacterized protein, partial [Littorina saxatilis]|uniref:uncharacterized protein n=1 Tax=Littorina saxatilis TaxID=31220 RepID=UPI0038B4FDC3
MATLRCCCLWVLLAAGCLAMSLDHEDEDQVAEVVKRMKRNSPDRIHGHSMATLHVDDPNTGHVHRLTRRDVINHVTDPAPRSRRFSLHLAAGDKVHMHLTRRNVVTSSTRITERLAGGAEISHVAPVDCFFTGPVEGSRGHAVMSLCEGQVMGTAQTETRQYEMHLLPREVAARKRRSTDLVHVLVTWTDLENAREPEEGLHRLRKRAGKDDMFYDADAMVVEESEMDQREKDAIITDPPLRNKTDRHAIVETAAFMDTFFQDAFVNNLGFPNDTEWFIRLALLKWSGIAAVMSDPKVGWNITVRLVVLEIWRQNPDWYNNEATATLGG